jgi:hypothetical protein
MALSRPRRSAASLGGGCNHAYLWPKNCFRLTKHVVVTRLASTMQHLLQTDTAFHDNMVEGCSDQVKRVINYDLG